MTAWRYAAAVLPAGFLDGAAPRIAPGTDDARDARAAAAWWCVALLLRGPAMQLGVGQGGVPRKGSIGSWMAFRGDTPASGYMNRLGAAAFWACVLVLLFPGRASLFSAATGLTAAHQFVLLRIAPSMSYFMMFVSNISLATASAAAALLSVDPAGALWVAARAAAPAVLECYAIMMVFAALGKLNARFFSPLESAATGHVMASIENLVALLPRPLRALLRRAVDAAGARAAQAFFQACCYGGFAVEGVVPLLMYANAPNAQLLVMTWYVRSRASVAARGRGEDGGPGPRLTPRRPSPPPVTACTRSSR